MTRLSRIGRSILAATALAGLVVASAPVWSQTPPAPQPGTPQTQPQPGQPPAEQPKWPDFNQVTKDMQSQSGLFTVYRYKSEDNSKDQTKLLAQIPRSLLKQDLLLATSISKGPQAGFQWEDFLIRFELQGKSVIINVPDNKYINTPNQPVSSAISRTYNDAFLAALPIVTMAPNGDPVVDMGSALLQPIVNLPIGGMLGGGGRGMMGGMGPRKDLSSYDKVKTFPDNVLIDCDLAVAGRTGGGQTIGVTYSFRRLPALGSYTPRVADERVGYFTTTRQDWAMKHSERENLVRYVNRWDLKKKDSSLELSPPEKPIVFIIEKTVPLAWRKYVAEGIDEWNKAYEKLGIVGAIVIQQQTDDNEFANVDPEDARYNFIRWIVTGQSFAMGPSRADPRTGQILDADIIFDDSMLRFYFRDFDVFGPAPVTGLMGPEFAQFLVENPEFIPMGTTTEQVRQVADLNKIELMHDAPSGSSEGSVNVVAQLRKLNPARNACSYSSGMREHLAMANLAVAAQGKKIPDRFIGEVIKEIVSHEVGHTLGLRHNFKASAWLSEAEIKRRRDTTDDALVSSVMDYNPPVFFAGDDITKIKHFISPCIGPYDFWAIEYGYKPAGGPDGDEKTLPGKIAGQNTKRELAYATDEDTMGLSSVDPLVNRFDLSDDPIAYARSRVALSDALLKDIKKWAVKNQEPNYYLRETFLTVMGTKARNMMFVSRIIGGQYFNRNRPGDADAKPALQLVEPKRQREAMDLLGSTLFKDDFFATEAELFNDLVPSRWWDWDAMPTSRVDFPVHQMIQSMQSYALLAMVSPQVLQRVYDAELKSKATDKFTAAELIQRTKSLVWGNLEMSDGAKFTDSQPMISSIRRNLQRQHVQYLLATIESRPGQLVSADLQGMVAYTLRDLSDKIGSLLGAGATKIDFASRAHLSETKRQIDRVLNSPAIQMPQMGGGIIVIGQDGQQRQK
jgi:hypothetical protein